jgi:type II restriction enzyme
MPSVITKEAIDRRKYWIEEIRKLSGDFGEDSDRVETELAAEIAQQGNGCLLDHLRLCGDIPESFDHDSTEEKLYSKYTDALLSECFRSLGFKSIVLKERADAADVEAFAESYSFVADAKAFRLSRTAKNQKDFKVQAMDVWKRGKPYAMVVCPIYQLPTRASQIYQQASARNVCVFTYSHLAVLSGYAKKAEEGKAEEILLAVFEAVKHLNPSKDANQYWAAINRTMLGFDKYMTELWAKEKVASVEAIAVAKDVALTYLASEREKIMRMSHQQALDELLRVHKIEARIQTVRSVSDTGLLSVA